MENQELLEYLYQTVDIGNYSCHQLLKDLHGKDNKIIDAIEDIQKEYLSFQEKLNKYIEGQKLKLKDVGIIAKKGSAMEMHMEIKRDNSDSKIADILMRGNLAGIIEIEKNLHKFEDKSPKEVVSLAKELIKFQQNSIEKLKKYL